MTKMYAFNVICRALLVVCCVSGGYISQGNASDHDATVYYEGDISAGANIRFFESVGDRKIRRLVIASMGGEVVSGIALGKWVFDNRIDVVVSDYCFSSCANYVFPAGRNKLILPGAIVAWHGNYHHLYQTGLWRGEIATRMRRHQESRDVASSRVLEQVQALVAAEKDFFDYIGIDQNLCWIGKRAPYRVPNYYFMSAADMSAFGLENIDVSDDYSQTDTDRFGVAIEFISLQTSSHKTGPGPLKESD